MNRFQAKRLLKLADAIQEAGRKRLYDQRQYNFGVKTECGCAMHHSDRVFGLTTDFVTFFGLDEIGQDEIFASEGCGNAGRSGYKAARYLRQFVARKLKESKP